MKLLSPNEFKKINENSEFNEFQENETPDFVILTDGRKLFHWEESFEDMASESNFMIKYAVGDEFETSEPTTYKEIESLLTPEDKSSLENYTKELGDSNAANSENWVK